jgi:hypothetical protein
MLFLNYIYAVSGNLEYRVKIGCKIYILGYKHAIYIIYFTSYVLNMIGSIAILCRLLGRSATVWSRVFIHICMI